MSTGGGYLCTYKLSIGGDKLPQPILQGAPKTMLLVAWTTHKNNKLKERKKKSVNSPCEMTAATAGVVTLADTQSDHALI